MSCSDVKPNGGEDPVQKPSVLYLTNNLPFPPDSGGQLREYQMLKRLAFRFNVHLVAFVRQRSGRDAISTCETFLASVTELVTSPASAPEGTAARMRDHYTSHGVGIIKSLISENCFALIHVEGYFLAQYLPHPSPMPVILVAENIEFAVEANAVSFGYTSFDPVTTEVFEAKAWNEATLCVCVTQQDAAILRERAPSAHVRCITNGIDHLYSEASSQLNIRPAGKQCLYVANFAWTPSRDAAIHLLRDIWPAIKRRVPNAQLLLAGIGMDDRFIENASQIKGVSLQGRYEYLTDVISEADLFLFPMRFGGGIKVKLTEVLTWGLPIVTTPEALNGFPEEIHRFVWTATTPDEFIDCAVTALNDLAGRTAKAKSADALVRQQMPTWDIVAGQLGDAWDECRMRV